MGAAGHQKLALGKPAHDAAPALVIKSTHIRLLVKDFDKEFLFFRDVLGFKATYGKLGQNYADFDCNGQTIALFKRSLMSEDLNTTRKPLEKEAQDRVALIFEVADVDATTELLQAHGVILVTTPHNRKDWGIRVAHFRDPDGNLIEINQGI
jgi:catechol 2,3-dioxygenase-like lactoylglutathione lyase family enzyme